MQQRSWPPDHRIPGYQGPYPVQQLEAARKVLINFLTAPPFSKTLEMIKPRIGIASCYGPAQCPPPLPEKQDQSFLYQRRSASDSNLYQRANITVLSPPNMFSRPSLHSTPMRNVHNAAPTSFRTSSSSETSIDSGFAGEANISPGYGDHFNKSFSSESVFNDSHGTAKSPSHSATLSSISAQANNLSLSTLVQSSSDGSAKRKIDPSIFDTPSQKKAKFVNQANLATVTQSSSADMGSSMERMYKCDFCKYTSKVQQQMHTHLTNAKHFSGSLYNANVSLNGIKFVSIEKMLAIKNPYSMTKTLVVACPNCNELFEDIFMCALHHKYTHGSVNGCYAICPVIRHDTISFSRRPICSTCNETFTRARDLHQHWNEVEEHHPLNTMKTALTNVFTLFICPYCSKIFYGNFELCKTHILAHPRNSDMYAMEVKHVMQPKRTQEIPPFNTTRRDGLKLELEILTNMSKFYSNDISQSKGKAKALRARIDTLNSLLYTY